MREHPIQKELGVIPDIKCTLKNSGFARGSRESGMASSNDDIRLSPANKFADVLSSVKVDRF